MNHMVPYWGPDMGNFSHIISFSEIVMYACRVLIKTCLPKRRMDASSAFLNSASAI